VNVHTINNASETISTADIRADVSRDSTFYELYYVTNGLSAGISSYVYRDTVDPTADPTSTAPDGRVKVTGSQGQVVNTASNNPYTNDTYLLVRQHSTLSASNEISHTCPLDRMEILRFTRHHSLLCGNQLFRPKSSSFGPPFFFITIILHVLHH